MAPRIQCEVQREIAKALKPAGIHLIGPNPLKQLISGKYAFANSIETPAKRRAAKKKR